MEHTGHSLDIQRFHGSLQVIIQSHVQTTPPRGGKGLVLFEPFLGFADSTVMTIRE